uniref:Uncharacterized protein n=1 Tax=Romanomermis culicivorax TaxID=13658 RepID=A0A915L3N6_ROMCU
MDVVLNGTEIGKEVENDLSPVWQDAQKESLQHLTESDASKASDDHQNGTAGNNNNRNSHNGSTHSSSSVLDFHRPCQSTDLLTVHLNDGQVATVQHPDVDRKFSRLHVGSAVASCGSRLDFEARDDFARKFKIKAFDVDFQTVIESILGNRINSWTLVRGICDYGDGTKNKEDWQPFAALQAALVAKMIVCKLPTFKQDSVLKN